MIDVDGAVWDYEVDWCEALSNTEPVFVLWFADDKDESRPSCGDGGQHILCSHGGHEILSSTEEERGRTPE